MVLFEDEDGTSLVVADDGDAGFPETWSSLRVAAIHGEVDGVVEELDGVLVWRGGSA